MGRIIKFRAWDKEQNKMTVFSLSDLTGWDTDQVFVDYQDPWIVGDKKLNSDLEIMQYTGLKDAEGREIYEGDILKTEVTHLVVAEDGWGRIWPKDHPNYSESYVTDIDEMIVYYAEDRGEWRMSDLNFYKSTKEYHGRSFDFWQREKNKIKVIGNKFENPELIRKFYDEEDSKEVWAIIRKFPAIASHLPNVEFDKTFKWEAQAKAYLYARFAGNPNALDCINEYEIVRQS